MQLLVAKQLDLDGKAKAYHPGDWVDVGKQTALRWIERREARTAKPFSVDVPADSGIVALGSPGLAGKTLASYGLPCREGAIGLPYQQTLLWEPTLPLRTDLVPAGLGFLAHWEAAAPMLSYERLADSIGTEAEREQTRALIHDLRVPAYETRLLFVRKCPAGEALLREWQAEEGNRALAFLRALYRVKPLFLALPVDWTQRA